MYERLLQEKKNDPFFERTVVVQVPSVENVPEVCVDIEAEYLIQITALVEDLQDTTDMGNYLLNPMYPIAEDMMGYLNCSNAVFVDWCYP